MASKPVAIDPSDDNNQPKGNKVPKTQETNEFTADDSPIPTQFDADDITVNGNIANGSSLSLDDLNQVGFNDEQDEAERAKLNPPTGDWDKEDRWQFEKRTNQEDCRQGDIDPTGRTFLSFAGKPKPRFDKGIDFEPMLFVRISPDRRFKQDKPTEIDLAYKLFLKAKDMYLELNSKKASNLRQLVTMLEEDAYQVRTMNGDNGPFVLDIKLKKERNKR